MLWGFFIVFCQRIKMAELHELKNKRAFNISEASDYACVSRGTVEFWLAKGLLPYENLPGSGDKQRFRRIRKKDLDEFLDKNLSVNQKHEKDKKAEPKDKPFLIPKTA